MVPVAFGVVSSRCSLSLGSHTYTDEGDALNRSHDGMMSFHEVGAGLVGLAGCDVQEARERKKEGMVCVMLVRDL